ncbi:MAG: hypothetical protein AAF598_12765 [Bacteroidota bacterium]
MKTFKPFLGLAFILFFFLAFSSTSFAGTGTATGTAEGGEQRADIKRPKDEKTGQLDVENVYILVGGRKNKLNKSEYTVTGKSSKSVSIRFSTPLRAGEVVEVDITTAERGNFGNFEMELE